MLLDPFKAFKLFAMKMDPEKAHDKTIHTLSKRPWMASPWMLDTSSDRFSVNTKFGKWPFPVGLAAGLDKNAECVDFFSRLGMGAVEVGTVTPKPQDGNPKPRLWRYIEKESLRNRMGFNNSGMEVMYNRIKNASRVERTLLGINLGKNKDTSAEQAYRDYQLLYEKLAPLADYLVINVSSPNTPGLRDLQSEAALEEILSSLSDLRKNCPRPLFVKLSPDLPFQGIEGVISLGKKYQLAGLIATNTTVLPDWGEGGVSGKALSYKAREVRNFILPRLEGELELIGVGGISSFADVWDFWKHGGRVVQIYSSFIFQGPGILKKFHYDMDRTLNKFQLKSIEELIANISKLELE